MASLRSRRLRKVEEALAALAAAPVPSIVHVGVGLTKCEALDRFRAKHPVLPPNHTGNHLVVPEKPSSPEQHDLFAARFKSQQLAAVKAVRGSYSQIADDAVGVNPIHSGQRLSKLESKTKRWAPGLR